MEAWSRRAFVKSGIASLAVATAPFVFVRNSWARHFTNDPGDAATVTFGFNIPQTGPYTDEGKDELRAFRLAVEHLNGKGDGGMLNTMKPLHLMGDGVLGKRVTFVVGNTRTNPKYALKAARRMVHADGVVMMSGSVSSAVAIALQRMAQDAGVIYMAGVTHSNDTTGKDRRRYGFRHFLNAQMSGTALGPVLAKELGDQRATYHLTADYTWGWTQEASIKETTDRLGWQTLKRVRTPIGTTDFSAHIEDIRQSGADTLILNHYGRDLVHSLTQITESNMRDRLINGKTFEVVVPLYSRLMAQGAGSAIQGVLGTVNWHWSLNDEGSKVFVNSFANRYGFPPSQAAHTCYVQTLLYANAVEMAETFYPPEVIRQLEGLQFDGMGNGITEYRAADHQCIKAVQVVRGKSEPSAFDLLEVVTEIPRTRVSYPPSRFPGTLGPY